MAARASALRQHTRRKCPNAAAEGRVVSFATGHGCEHHRAVGAKRRPPPRSAAAGPDSALPRRTQHVRKQSVNVSNVPNPALAQTRADAPSSSIAPAHSSNACNSPPPWPPKPLAVTRRDPRRPQANGRASCHEFIDTFGRATRPSPLQCAGQAPPPRCSSHRARSSRDPAIHQQVPSGDSSSGQQLHWR